MSVAESSYWPTEEEQHQPGYRVLAAVDHGDISAEIYTLTGDSFLLTWSDGVANSWLEKHHVLHNALARIAALAFCSISGWQKGFAQSSEAEFAKVARSFFRDTVA